MDNLENWEETISSKFNEQQFPFDEMNWDRAEEQIDARDKSRKRKKMFGIYFVGMVSGSLLMFGAQKLFFAGEHKSTQIVYVNATPNAIANNSNAQNNNVTADQNNNASNSATNNSQINSVGNNNGQNVASNNSNNIYRHHNYSGNSNYYNGNNSAQNNSSVNDVAANPVSNDNNNVVAVAQNPLAPVDANNNNSQTTTVTGSDDKLVQPNNSIAHQTAAADTNHHNMPMVNKNNFDNSHSNLPGKLDSIRHRMNHIIVEVGGNYIMGWYHPAEGRGFNPVGGFVYAHEFNSGFIGNVGVRYEQIGHLEESQKKFIDSNPGFGLNNSSTIIVPSTLRFVSVPFKLEKSFTGNIFGIGANISYLVGTTSRLETWTENDSHQLTIIDTHSENGYLGGFHRWNESLTLSYRRQLLPKFGIQMEATYQLNDLKNNYYFSNSKDVAEHIFGFRAMLTYRIF